MDNREAVNWLINISADIGKVEHSDLWHYEQALTEIKNMLESAQLSKEGATSDLISRQETLDALMDAVKKVGVLDADDIKAVFDMLPSVQHEKTQLSKEGTTKDTISRQAAIDALHTWFRDGFDEDKWWNSTHVLAAIEGLPSVQQEHKWETCFECPLSHGCPKIKGCTNEQAVDYAGEIPGDCPLSAQPEPHEGHWIPHESLDGGEQYECSRCGVLWEFNDGTPEDNEAYYCPKCGAKMKGVRHESY